jgi:ATP-binding cassette subfamily B (MDR/TAP) protein 1
MTTIAPQILTLTKASSAAKELFQTIDRVSEIDPLSEVGLIPIECIGELQIKDVHFAYPARPDTAVLKGLTLSVPANKTTALVGASGSGKSTIISLLERWYDQAEGTLHLDGVDTRELNLRWLRTNMRLVQQEPTLFSGTVFENVAFGLFGAEKSSLPEAKQRILVEKACKAAYADEFIERLPKVSSDPFLTSSTLTFQGYDTQIGERAMMLSGGQKQRLAIARSIVSDPKVLLLDEATSALDPKAEKIVQRALDNVSQNRTTIVIAHKLSTIRNADNIAVMSDGAVVEQGTHDELLEANGAYARLVRAQDLGHADREEDLDGYDHEDKASLVRTQTQVGSIHGEATKEKDKDKDKDKDGINYSLFRCIVIILMEQGGLWPWFLMLTIAAILGGNNTNFIFHCLLLIHHRTHISCSSNSIC